MSFGESTRALNDWKLTAGRGVTFNKPYGQTKFSISQSAPRQKGSVECGYYIMRYMRDIIFNGWKDFAKIEKYTHSHLDEVRSEWGSFVSGFIDWRRMQPRQEC